MAKERVVASKQLLDATKSSLLTNEKLQVLLEYSRRSLQIDEWPLLKTKQNSLLCCSTSCEAELNGILVPTEETTTTTTNNDTETTTTTIIINRQRSTSRIWWLSNEYYQELQSIYQQTNDSDAVKCVCYV